MTQAAEQRPSFDTVSVTARGEEFNIVQLAGHLLVCAQQNGSCLLWSSERRCHHHASKPRRRRRGARRGGAVASPDVRRFRRLRRAGTRVS